MITVSRTHGAYRLAVLTALRASVFLLEAPAAQAQSLAQASRGKPAAEKAADALGAPTIADPSSNFFKPSEFRFKKNGRREPFAPLYDPTATATLKGSDDDLTIEGLTLRGLMTGGTRSIALFRTQQGTLLRLYQGQTLGNFTITAIDATGVRVIVRAPFGAPTTLRLSVPRLDSLRKTP
jgi:hypothetical protein